MSASFTPSDLQAKAIREIKNWFLHRTAEQQVFRVFGYAGTGKTTLTRHAVDELALDTMTREDGGAGGCVPGGVLYAAFTGKAALVMTRKGTPASTIHSLIYRVSEATAAEIERVEKQIDEMKVKLPTLDPAVRLFEESRLRSLEIRLDDIHKPGFVLNEQSIVRDAPLIVLDEVSMVGDEMACDLLAFGKPILVLGDPGQLPPIKGDGAFTGAAPGVMLTEIHRQAGESAIIRLATMARQSLPIPYGEHDAHVWKMPRLGVLPEQMLRGGQVICGRNATRVQLNNAMKRAAGFDTVYPTGRNGNGAREKIICLKNRKDLGIVNGSDGTLITEPGYHPATRLLYEPAQNFTLPPVPDDPTPQQIAAARSLLLDDLLGEFPFVSEAERAHALALLLLPFIRPMIAGPTPLHMVEKPAPGTGATLMVDAISIVTTGTSASVMVEGRDEDEWRKRLTAKLRDIPSILLIDNLRRQLDASSVAAALAAPYWEDQVLGKSEMTRFPIRCVWIATGNTRSSQMRSRAAWSASGSIRTRTSRGCARASAIPTCWPGCGGIERAWWPPASRSAAPG